MAELWQQRTDPPAVITTKPRGRPTVKERHGTVDLLECFYQNSLRTFWSHGVVHTGGKAPDEYQCVTIRIIMTSLTHSEPESVNTYLDVSLGKPACERNCPPPE